jgi:DNA-binding XRE family transcriptional regulator
MTDRIETLDPFARGRSKRVDLRGEFRGRVDDDVPSTQELGRRFKELRTREGISRAEAARRVRRSAATIARFEKEGKASAALLLDLVRAMSSAAGFADAFLAPRFKSIQEVVRHRRSAR